MSTSLDRLHDIVVPPPAPWWPPAPGWFVVLAAGSVLLVWALSKFTLEWRRDRYRRAALAELATIRPDGVAQISELLKRAALATYPREEVAGLSGEAWLAFLDRVGGTTAFTSGPGRALADGPYARAASGDVGALLETARVWLQHHRRGPGC